jgi:hypothetical protein
MRCGASFEMAYGRERRGFLNQGTRERPIQQEYYRSWGRLGFRVSRGGAR